MANEYHSKFGALLNLFLGIILAMPPSIRNIAHEILTAITIHSPGSFDQTAEIMKIIIIVFGYFLVVISISRLLIYYFNPKYM